MVSRPMRLGVNWARPLRLVYKNRLQGVLTLTNKAIGY